jgi:hypothetical protein
MRRREFLTLAVVEGSGAQPTGRALRAMRMEETIAAPPRKKRPCVSDVCRLVGNSATGDDYGLRAVARPWRAGAGIGDFVRRTNRDLRKL